MTALRVGVPERTTGPYAPVPPRVVAALESVGAEVVVLRRGVRREPVFDALLLTGGPTPLANTEARKADAADRNSTMSDAERDERELAHLDRSLTAGRPVLGVCRGMQLLTIYAGGRLQPVDEGVHAGGPGGERRPAEHAVSLSTTSTLARAVGVERLMHCASQHSYGVALDGATSVAAIGWADDGTVEAIEFDSTPAYGVLWHPEDTYLVEPRQLDVLRTLWAAH